VTGRIAGTIVNPATVPDWPSTYRDYFELGYLEYDVVLRVRDSASVDERHLIWRVYLDCLCGNKASTYKAEYPIPYIAQAAGNVVTNYDVVAANEGEGIGGYQARAQRLADRFHRLDTVKAFQAAIGDAIKATMKKILGLDEKWENILKIYERVEKVKSLLEFITREDNVVYTYEYKEDTKNWVKVIFAYSRKTEEWYGIYGGRVGGVRPTDQAMDFAFYVHGTAVPKDRGSGLLRTLRESLFPFGEPYTVTAEKEIHWIRRR